MEEVQFMKNLLLIILLLISSFSMANSKNRVEKDDIKIVIRNNKKLIRACYEKALINDPNLKGKIVARWTIDAEGSVIEANIQSSTIKNEDLSQCLLNEIKSWKFPKPPIGSEAEVVFPFIFKK